LHEHAREDLLLADDDALAVTVGARVDVAVGCGTGAAAMVTEHAFFDHELRGREV